MLAYAGPPEMDDVGTLFRSLAVDNFTPEPDDSPQLYHPLTQSDRQMRRYMKLQGMQRRGRVLPLYCSSHTSLCMPLTCCCHIGNQTCLKHQEQLPLALFFCALHASCPAIIGVLTTATACAFVRGHSGMQSLSGALSPSSFLTLATSLCFLGIVVNSSCDACGCWQGAD